MLFSAILDNSRSHAQITTLTKETIGAHTHERLATVSPAMIVACVDVKLGISPKILAPSAAAAAPNCSAESKVKMAWIWYGD